MTSFLLDRFSRGADQGAIVFRNDEITYGALEKSVGQWLERFKAEEIAPGDTVAFIGDFSPNTIALYLALALHKCVLVPLSREHGAELLSDFITTAQVNHVYRFDHDDKVIESRKTSFKSVHPHIQGLRDTGKP